MTFDVGGADYVVVRRHVLVRQGKKRRAFFDGPARQLLICGDIRDELSVLSALQHEHRHALEFELGICQGCPESRAQLGVVASRTFMRDWNRAGGLNAFLALPIGGTLPLPPYPTTLKLPQACRHCGYLLVDGRCQSCE